MLHWKQLFVVFVCVLYKTMKRGSQREKGGIFVIKSENGNMNQTSVFIVNDDPKQNDENGYCSCVKYWSIMQICFPCVPIIEFVLSGLCYCYY